ncbi:hypothetical protein SUDANB171_00343 [Streptomyces sp. enrichment culture]|jgi:hypothetical protein|uniref:hypothetical protein n=1 Tax=Streptomyces xiamenensis TaxID=408015 RepID=UPI0037D4033A
MTALTTLAVTALTGIALTAAAPAQDSDSFAFSLSPQTVQPGGTVTLTATGCTGAEAFAESGVFDRISLGTPGQTQSARTTVNPAARPGSTFDVTFTCGAQSGRTTLTVNSTVAAAATPTPAATAGTATAAAGKEGAATPTADSTTLPTLGSQAGTGGSQRDLTPVLLTGAGLTATALTGGVLLYRRRAQQQR